MKAVIQHVKDCSITVNNEIVSSISHGLLCYIGIRKEDGQKDIDYIIDKILNLRILEDENEKMNLSVLDKKLEIMLVSQFTLYGNTKKGRRPSFDLAMDSDNANLFFEEFINILKRKYDNIKTGKFQSTMFINYTNIGPKTFIVES